MIREPMDALNNHPIRNTKKQKANFRTDAISFLEGLGYVCSLNKPKGSSQNVLAGDPHKAKILITAHYDTPATLPIPNLITPNNFLLYMLYQVLVLLIMLAPPVIGYFAVSCFATQEVAEIVADLLLWAVILLPNLGPANKHNANDNTSGVVTLLTIAKNLPAEYRDQVCFVLFDNEEKGLLGSNSYSSTYWADVHRQTVLNLDCVGEGKDVVFYPTGKLKKDAKRINWLNSCVGSRDGINFSVAGKGFSFYPSDQMNFPYGVGIAALKHTKNGVLYLDKIHTKKDTVLKNENVLAISDCLIEMISNSAQLPCEPHNGKIPKRMSAWTALLIGMGIAVLLGFIAGATGYWLSTI